MASSSFALTCALSPSSRARVSRFLESCVSQGRCGLQGAGLARVRRRADTCRARERRDCSRRAGGCRQTWRCFLLLGQRSQAPLFTSSRSRLEEAGRPPGSRERPRRQCGRLRAQQTDRQTAARRLASRCRGRAGDSSQVDECARLESPLSYPDYESSCRLFRISDRVFGRDDALLNLKSSEKGGLDLEIPPFLSPSRRGS